MGARRRDRGRLRPRLPAALIAASLLHSAPAGAMAFNLVGNTLIMSGPVVSDDLARLKDQLATDKVKLVVLHQSPGGETWNALQLARRIRDKGLPTAVSGTCASGCGLIFLGGVERSFSDGMPLAKTRVGLHGVRNVETNVASQGVSAKVAYFIREMTAEKFPRELLDQTVYSKDPEDIVFVLPPKLLPKAPATGAVVKCPKPQDAKLKCELIPGLDAMTIGVITNAQPLLLAAEVKAKLANL